MSETPTVDEQYSTAVAARSLLIDPVHRTQADVIIAADPSEHMADRRAAQAALNQIAKDAQCRAAA